MKILNYSRQYETYKEMFESEPELNISLDEWDILKEKMPFGKYQGMWLIDLIDYDHNYFNYMKNKIFNEKVSGNLNTYNSRIKLLRVMISVERYYKIERVSEDYERKRQAIS